MKASARLVIYQRTAAIARIERGDALGAAINDAIAAEQAIYAEYCARLAYGLPVDMQRQAFADACKAVGAARSAFH